MSKKETVAEPYRDYGTIATDLIFSVFKQYRNSKDEDSQDKNEFLRKLT